MSSFYFFGPICKENFNKQIFNSITSKEAPDVFLSSLKDILLERYIRTTNLNEKEINHSVLFVRMRLETFGLFLNCCCHNTLFMHETCVSGPVGLIYTKQVNILNEHSWIIHGWWTYIKALCLNNFISTCETKSCALLEYSKYCTSLQVRFMGLLVDARTEFCFYALTELVSRWAQVYSSPWNIYVQLHRHKPQKAEANTSMLL